MILEKKNIFGDQRSVNKDVKTFGDIDLTGKRPKKSFRVMFSRLLEQTSILRILQFVNNLICLLSFLVYLILTYIQIYQYQADVQSSLDSLKVLPHPE